VKKVTLNNYRSDKFYPRINRAVATIRDRGDIVIPIEVFQEMGLLERERVEDWHRGRIPYLEKVIRCNLSSAGRILRILRTATKKSGGLPLGWMRLVCCCHLAHV
jgi:hypothetical protein